MLRTLLIDDEPLARGVLRKLVAAHPLLVVAAEAGTYAESELLLTRGDYDLVLLDIQLRGGNGFDLVPAVRPGARIIFVTAFDRFALRAFEVNALDYLLKPVTAERFAASLERLNPVPTPVTAPQPAGGNSPGPRLGPDDTVYVRTDNGDRFVPVADISAVLSNGNYSDVMLRHGERLFTRRAMKTWEELLPAAHFMRVHRHALINLTRVEEHHRVTRETIAVRVTGLRAPVSVSRHCLAALIPRLAAQPG